MTHYSIKIMPTARLGLLTIGDYIALDNPIRAISFVDEITDSLQKTLSLFPYSGKKVDDLSAQQEIRVWSYGRYNCYYHIIEQKSLVEILFVFHASRDVQKLMDKL